MAELINHPHEMRKLQDEVRGAAGRVTEDHLDGMAYLKAVISETMRLHAPAALLILIPRETTEDTELLGYYIPARTRVVINAWAIGRDPASWERAEEFAPERFVDAPVDYSRVGLDFRFVPFGADDGAGARQHAVPLRLGVDDARRREETGDAVGGRERGVRAVRPAQGAVGPRR
jgi:cytochrome P450